VPGVVQGEPRDAGAPFVEHDDQLAGLDRLDHAPLGDERDPEPIGGCLRHQLVIIERERPFDVDGVRLATPLEFPAIDSPASHAMTDARVLVQVGRRARHAAVLLQVPR
jgi:hypothetical protein